MRILPLFTALLYAAIPSAAPAGTSGIDTEAFRQEIEPLLTDYCYDCHGDGMAKGGVALDEATGGTGETDYALWHRALKNLRAEIMPPPQKPQPSEEERERLVHWLKYSALGLDPAHPDPGHVTVRRLNRIEYRNTIRDLMGVDFNTEVEFPPDDTGYGFDNIGDVLVMSPLLAEKYLEAAQAIVSQSVPQVTRAPAEQWVPGQAFTKLVEGEPQIADTSSHERRGSLTTSFYEPASLGRRLAVDETGEYKVILEFTVSGGFDFDPGRCRVTFGLNGETAFQEALQWQNNKVYHHTIPISWEAGSHLVTYALEPLTPKEDEGDGIRLRLDGVRVQGPLDEEKWVNPENYERFFHLPAPPANPAARKEYTREVIARFLERAHRRPADPDKVERLLGIVERGGQQTGWTYEQAVSQAFAAILASPHFLYRIEAQAEATDDKPYPLIDEHALASRLAYFLWSTMPDDDLFALADKGELRRNLGAQVLRMLEDKRSQAFIDHFSGQWLQVRNVDLLKVDERSILARDAGNEKELKQEEEASRARIEEFREKRREWAEQNAIREKEGLPPLPRPPFRFSRPQPPAVELDGDLRRAFRSETQEFFAHIVKEDRSILEFLDSDYTFLNEPLAKHYGIPGVEGPDMRLVKLPEDSVRGGILTQGSVLLVTSNPTRTSPVKRGLFILDNLMGTPPPPPPADVPSLEEAEEDLAAEHEPTVKEALERHRNDPLCMSCHERMDPLGFALENFNALGMWREEERRQKIDSTGQLVTGESFKDIRELKRILKEDRRLDFYRCFTEKLFTYALGRGPEYYDIETIDQIVAQLESEQGRFTAALLGIIESPPFQRQRKILDPRADKSQTAD